MDLPRNGYHVPRFMEESYNPLKEHRQTEIKQAKREHPKPVGKNLKISSKSKLKKRETGDITGIVSPNPIPPIHQQPVHKAIDQYPGKRPSGPKLEKRKVKSSEHTPALIPSTKIHQQAEHKAIEQSPDNMTIEFKLKKRNSKSGGHISVPVSNSPAHQQAEHRAIERIKANYVIDESGILVTSKMWEKDHPIQKTVSAARGGRRSHQSSKFLPSSPSPSKPKDFVACGVCSAQVRERNLRRHFLKVHPNEPTRSVKLSPKK